MAEGDSGGRETRGLLPVGRGFWEVHFHIALWEVLCGVSSDVHRMEQRELRHDRHTVSLLADHTVFSPKQSREILAGVVALALDGVIRKTCKDPNIEIIDMAVNVDHVHLFVKYPPKYSVSYIAKRIKGRSSRELRKAFPHLKEWCNKSLWAPSCFHGSVGHGWKVVREIHTKSGEAECENAMYRLRT